MIITEAYRSGHNEAVLKTVWVNSPRGFESLRFRQEIGHPCGVLFSLAEAEGENRKISKRFACSSYEPCAEVE